MVKRNIFFCLNDRGTILNHLPKVNVINKHYVISIMWYLITKIIIIIIIRKCSRL